MKITEKIKKIKRDNEQSWLAFPDVVSVGIGYVHKQEPGIIIGVKSKKDAIEKKIPSQIDGIPVVIKRVDEIKAF